MPEVVLYVNGKKHGGWKSVSISNSMRSLAATFRLDFSDRWPGEQEKYSIAEGSRCRLTLGGQLVVEGWVDQLAPEYDNDNHSLTITGRDLCADLVDCCHIGEKINFDSQGLLAIARELLKPFNLSAVADADLGPALPKARYGQGESIHEFLLKLCRIKGVLPVSFGDGVLHFATAGLLKTGAALVQGKNIKAARAEFSSAERFSDYIVKGQGQAAKWFDQEAAEGEDAARRLADRAAAVSPKGSAKDTAVKRHRPLVILAESTADQQGMEKRAKWEAVNRAGHSRAVTYTVQGWEHSPGSLWKINRLVRVEDALLGISGQYLIESVTLNQSENGGTTADIGIVHPEAYAAKPDDQKASKVKTSWDWGGE